MNCAYSRIICIFGSMELRRTECYKTTSHEERLDLLERMKDIGIPIGETAWRDRNKPGDHTDFPVISFDGFHISLCRRGVMKHQLTCDEFKEKVGLTERQYKGTIPKHHFI